MHNKTMTNTESPSILCVHAMTGFVRLANSSVQAYAIPHRVGGNRKRSQQSTNAIQKSIETAFSIAICRQLGDKWQ